jgi:hypothetical protein
MASAKIGALHVELGIDSAQFSAGLHKAQGDLGKFGKLAAGVAASVAALGAAAMASLGSVVKSAADHADALSKAAQKVGVTVEALSRLEWAAKLSDVSLEQLTGGLGRLSKAMSDAAAGSQGPASTAFAALGIAVTDATGNLRAADAVFGDLAEAFARLEDGSTKTALAINIFGRAGTDLIPLLNSGRDGLRAAAEESDRFGRTITTRAAQASEQFNDSLTRLNGVLEGLGNKVLEAAVPALERFSGFVEDPQVQQGVLNLTNLVFGLGDAMAWVAKQFAPVAGVAGTLKAYGLGDAVIPGMVPQPPAGAAGANQQNLLPGADLGLALGPLVTLPDVAGQAAGSLKGIGDVARAAANAIDPLRGRITELSDVLTMSLDPISQMQLDLTDLKTIWQEGRISAEQYGEAVMRTQANAAASVFGMAGQISGALAGMFKDNKAFAVANAVINTAEGATKALAQGGVWGFVGAAAVVASGAAQIAAIMSAQPGSASTAAVNAPVADTAMSQPSQSINVTLAGSGRYSRDEVLDLLDQIASAAGDRGMSINLSRA